MKWAQIILMSFWFVYPTLVIVRLIWCFLMKLCGTLFSMMFFCVKRRKKPKNFIFIVAYLLLFRIVWPFVGPTGLSEEMFKLVLKFKFLT